MSNPTEPRLTQHRLAADFKVSKSCMRAWLIWAKEERRAVELEAYKR